MGDSSPLWCSLHRCWLQGSRRATFLHNNNGPITWVAVTHTHTHTQHAHSHSVNRWIVNSHTHKYTHFYVQMHTFDYCSLMSFTFQRHLTTASSWCERSRDGRSQRLSENIPKHRLYLLCHCWILKWGNFVLRTKFVCFAQNIFFLNEDGKPLRMGHISCLCRQLNTTPPTSSSSADNDRCKGGSHGRHLDSWLIISFDLKSLFFVVERIFSQTCLDFHAGYEGASQYMRLCRGWTLH